MEPPTSRASCVGRLRRGTGERERQDGPEVGRMSTEKPTVPQSTAGHRGAGLSAREALRAGLLSGSETAKSGSGLFPAVPSGGSDLMDSDRIQESNRIPEDRDRSHAA